MHSLQLQRSVDRRLALNYLEILLLLLVDTGADIHAQLDERIQSTLAFIGANFAPNWTVSDLALHRQLSAPRFAGLFGEQLGVAPM